MKVRNSSKSRKSGTKTPTARRGPIIGLDQVSESTIYPHIFGNPDREVGGVLVGRVSEALPLPLITGAIPAISADEQRATLTFTQDSWEHVHRTLENDFPEGEQIVGWYHSHPSFGIFLSSHDLFIHHNFFSGASQIAVVVDPITQTEGAFVWKDEEVVPLFEVPTPARWVAEPVVLPPRNGGQPPVEVAPEEEESPYPTAPLAIAAVVGLLLGLGIAHTFFGGSDAPQPSQNQVQQQAPAQARPQQHARRQQQPQSEAAQAQAAQAAQAQRKTQVQPQNRSTQPSPSPTP